MREQTGSTWEELGIDLKGRTAGNFKTKCPRCNGKGKDLSVNITEGLWKCHHSECLWSGSLMPKNNFTPLKRKEYKMPEVNNTELRDSAVAWFEKRGISKSTLIRFKVKGGEEWMPQTKKKEYAIQFQYFVKGEVVNIKYRSHPKNFKLAKDAKLIFYGLDTIEDSTDCIICEGEIDALSFYEAGSFPVVSVPNGASSGRSNLEYLDNCWSYFENKTKIIIATDNDDPGRALKDELIRRLGAEKCFTLQYPEGCKDANEVLKTHGVNAVKKMIVDSKPIPLEGIITAEDEYENVYDLWRNGYPKGLKIGHPKLDELISWRQGELTLITGAPGSGKSEIMDDVFIRLAAIHGWKFAVLSPENQPVPLHIAKLAEKVVGMPFYAREGKMNELQLKQALSFINEHFYFIKINHSDLTIDYVLNKAKELVLRKGINGLVIDPWNRLHHDYSGKSETQYVNEALTKIYLAKETLNVHVFMVAHPTKLQKDKLTGKYHVATLYDISGSAHFYNKTDNGLSIYRDLEEGNVFAHVQKIRFKFIGKIGVAEFNYNTMTGQYKEIAEANYRSFLDRYETPELPLKNDVLGKNKGYDTDNYEEAPF